ncbi:uncharacterized protein EDB91DRAFT_1151850 [Suillus paluster]|uniref:uncharacterized protein n=1 Tax=Suillus paluster TaxID=48578 RepID=UPI001B86C3D5|nr:uncharacterized protein EDB91DRAFT_1151850 [Suillus paluster]KAG1732418.1 hypothetical protein EDB91DRAFT_1151850 [Suillus paluster]
MSADKHRSPCRLLRLPHLFTSLWAVTLQYGCLARTRRNPPFRPAESTYGGIETGCYAVCSPSAMCGCNAHAICAPALWAGSDHFKGNAVVLESEQRKHDGVGSKHDGICTRE